MRFLASSILLAIFAFGLNARATSLFDKGPEVFSIQDSSGKAPVFRVLDKTASEKALAMALLTTLNLQPDVDPKFPVTGYVDLKIEEFFLAPAKDRNELDLSVRLNGRYLVIPKAIDRAKFLAGETIDMTFPLKQKDVSAFELSSDGRLKMRLKKETNEIEIQNAMGHLTYSAPFVGSGDEKVQFTGKGIRKL